MRLHRVWSELSTSPASSRWSLATTGIPPKLDPLSCPFVGATNRDEDHLDEQSRPLTTSRVRSAISPEEGI